METLDTRRLTGLNVFWDRPGSVMDVSCTTAERERFEPVWTALARRMLDALGWAEHGTMVRSYDYGISLVLSAPIDALYAACEVNDWLWSACQPPEPTSEEVFLQAVARLQEVAQAERNPALCALHDAACARGLAFLHDDDACSIGLGHGSQTWPISSLPATDEVDWQKLHNIPVALVTGTNGKTTTTRMVAAIVAAAGHCPGTSSTDWIAVDREIIEHGDFSGPGGARTVLRDSRVEMAVLETARGGLLRRGLGVEHADAVVITTIAEDHLGDFGSRSVDELLAIKWVTTRALAGKGHLILSADEPRLVRKAAETSAPIIWFSLRADNPVVKAHLNAGGRAAIACNDQIMLIDEHNEVLVCSIASIPLSVGGAAAHNVSNALAAAAMAWSFGIAPETIAKGLQSVGTHENPGRCSVFSIGGRQVVLDFAHNAQAMQAIIQVARALPAQRRLLSFGQAGDRPDADIQALARQAWTIGLDRVHIVELPKYQRGRTHGEVCALLRAALLDAGAHDDDIGYYDSELDSLQAAIAWAQPGDLVLLMVLASTTELVALMEELAD